MTTTTLTGTRSDIRPPADGAFGRILNVVRLHLVNKMTTIYVPWMIMAFIFLVNYAIWWILLANLDPADMADASEGIQFSGASAYIFVYMLVVAVQAINLTFPFAQGYSVTRRDFYLGSALTFMILSAGYSIVMTLLGLIECATNGWGIGGSMFATVYFGSGDNVLESFYITFLLFLFFFFVGTATATVYVRWRANGMLVFFACLVLVILGLVALATFTGSWPAVGAWFVASGAVGVVTWMLVPTALAALVGFLILRRATPRN
jgi:hypothetical protein